MVLESLTNPKKAERRLKRMLLIGFIYATVALFISLWVFKEQASMVLVFLTVIAATPLMYHTIAYEEKKDTKLLKERTLLKEHSKALSFFMYLFIGIVIAFSLWYIFLPGHLTENLFSVQIQTINQINSQVTGQATVSSFAIPSIKSTASSINSSNLFLQIFSNNVKVLLFCIFFSFFFGAGAIFILTWNASVISAAAGTFIKSNLSKLTELVGFPKIAAYFHVVSLGLLKYAIHGIPEILAYFTGGLAGGIISVAVIRHDFGSKTFKHIVFDSLDLVILAIVLVLISAVLEVFVTPALF